MNDKQENSRPEKSSTENLIHLSEKNTVVNSSDLNNRLADIEKELRHLNAREAATNKGFRELLSETRKQTGEQDMQIEETREQVVEIKGNYKKLSQDYQRLAASANLLSATLEQARSELSSDVESLRLSTRERTDQLADGQLQLIERANRIEQKANQMAEDLDSRINVIRTTVSALESKLEEQIREMATQSEQRDEALLIRTNMLEEDFKQADSKLNEKIDQVEKDSEERFENLDVRARELSQQTEDLQFQVNVVDTRATDLEERSDSLEETTGAHATKLSQIDNTVDRHHKGFAIALVLIVVTLGILSILQQNRWLSGSENDVATGEKLAAQQQVLASQAAVQQQNSQRIDTLEAQNDDAHGVFSSTDEKITAAITQLEQSINSLNEKTENSTNRMNAMAPHQSFGLDNTIHTPDWLAQQNSEHYVVQVASTENKQDLYAIATRWSMLFNQSNLSYIEQQQAGKKLYTLVYGTFADKRNAEMISRRLPLINFDNRPAAMKLADLL